MGVLTGDMEIKSGRLMLTDGEACSFGLTDKGRKRAEDLINSLK